MKTFKDIHPQITIDRLCADYRRLDQHLVYPKNGLPTSFGCYMHSRAGKMEWLCTRYFRNISTLEKFKTSINRMDSLWTAIEYFNGIVSLHRSSGKDFEKPFLDEFFISIAADSLRSTLDIYAKIVGCYFDFPNMDIGYSYKYLIEPLKQINFQLYNSCNNLYKSTAFEEVKSFRNKEKHIGLDGFNISITGLKEELDILLTRPEPINIASLEKSVCILLSDYCQLITTTVDEFIHWPLGYNSPRDKILIEEEDGSFRMPNT